MRFRNLLGLLAIGGAAAYAYKKRGGDLSIEGIKNSLRGVADKVQARADRTSARNISTDVDDRGGYDDAYSRGYGSTPGSSRT